MTLILDSVLIETETCNILTEWTSKSLVKRVWAHGDFPDIVDGIDRRINVFRDAFSVGASHLRTPKLMSVNTQVARLISLSNNQNILDTKMCVFKPRQSPPSISDQTLDKHWSIKEYARPLTSGSNLRTLAKVNEMLRTNATWGLGNGFSKI